MRDLFPTRVLRRRWLHEDNSPAHGSHARIPMASSCRVPRSGPPHARSDALARVATHARNDHVTLVLEIDTIERRHVLAIGAAIAIVTTAPSRLAATGFVPPRSIG